MADRLPPGCPTCVRLRLEAWKGWNGDTPVDYHLHTTHTDGRATVSEMAQAAASIGMTEVLFSEHVRHTSAYFPSFVHEVRELQCPGMTALVGAEAKILDLDGHLDCSPEIAGICDGIIGSVHSLPRDEAGLSQSWSRLEAETALKLEFQLALAIVSKSRAHILGHPMGMVIKTFGVRPLEHLYRLACACRESGKAFELNPGYCSSPKDWIDVVKTAGCRVSLGSDAHSPLEVGNAWSVFMMGRETPGRI